MTQEETARAEAMRRITLLIEARKALIDEQVYKHPLKLSSYYGDLETAFQQVIKAESQEF